jgi:cytochrome c oxidase assembly protein subunit 15
MERKSSLQKWLFVYMLYLLAVVLFGTVVRATHSGAGCGSDWPLCRGDWIPASSSLHTWIEYSHRLTSGLTLPLGLFFYAWSRRRFPKGHPCRRALMGVLLFLTSEALVGAGIVWLDHVARNESSARGLTMSIHLINTFTLMACAVLSWIYSGRVGVQAAPSRRSPWAYGGLGLILLVGISGAITALGDTLFPPSSLGEAFSLAQETSSHLFIRLRIYHPFLALCSVAYLGFFAWHSANMEWERRHRYFWFMGILLLQVVVGYWNVHLLAPVWMQVVHLFVAQCVWMSYVGIWIGKK